jgi:hypothetical protein
MMNANVADTAESDLYYEWRGIILMLSTLPDDISIDDDDAFDESQFESKKRNIYDKKHL